MTKKIVGTCFICKKEIEKVGDAVTLEGRLVHVTHPGVVEFFEAEKKKESVAQELPL